MATQDGVGRVVAVSGKAYTVDVLTGDFDLNDSVTLYRRDNYAAASCVGKGDVNRREALLFAGAGRVADVAVREGETVTAGQKLFSLVSADAAPAAAAPDVLCQTDGVVEQVLVAPGQRVWKGRGFCAWTRRKYAGSARRCGRGGSGVPSPWAIWCP